MAKDAIAENSQLELEAKRKADGSWHPCTVSLCSGGGLSVKFEGQDSKIIILDVEDVFSCLRVRSIPLEGDDCCYIEEGQHVLTAFEQNSDRLFFDATVQKVVRVRHSKRASCRCSFMIKWHSELAENDISSVPSCSILKLATTCINSHPVVAAFLNSMEKQSLSTPSPPMIFDDTEGEIDLHGLLKQIEGTSSLTEASNKDFPKDTLVGVDYGRRDDQTKLVAEHVDKYAQVSGERNHLRRLARRQNKPEITTEDLTTAEPSCMEKSEQNLSPLSPLAARAVLASLVSNFPQKIKSVHEERSCVSVLFGGSGTHIVNKVDLRAKNYSKASGEKLSAQMPNGTLVMEVCNKIESSIDLGSGLSSSMRDESTLPMAAHSTMKREGANVDRDDKTIISALDATTVLVTRSAAHKGKGSLNNQISGNLLDKKVTAPRSTCSAIKYENEVSDVEDKNRTLDGGANVTILSSNARVTRSAARAGTRNLEVRAKESFQVGSNFEPVYEASVSTKKRISTLINAELKLTESDKKQKGLIAVEKRQNRTAEDLDSNVDTQALKKSVSSKKPPSRFSPRLRFSPRIQSHENS